MILLCAECTIPRENVPFDRRMTPFAVLSRLKFEIRKNSSCKSFICQNCPVREQCTQNQQCVKTVTRHVWHDYIERADDIRHSPLGKKTYALRSQTIERVFADAKEKHAMRYTPYRGLTAVTTCDKLKFAALNLKKFAIHKWMFDFSFFIFSVLESTSRRCKVASLTN